MKNRHLLTALLIAALLMLTCAGALAATDRSAAPKLTLDAPTEPITAGATVQLSATTNIPGFLTLRLLNASGAEVLTVCTNRELHTKSNDVGFATRLPDGSVLPMGTYTLSGQMVSQFGVSSNDVTATVTIGAAPEVDEVDEADGVDDEPTETAASSGSSAQSSPASSSSSSTKQSTASSQNAKKVGYTGGSFTVGEEGLQIGVGVTDVAEQTDAGYWGLSASSSDEEIWAALTRTMTAVNVDERESAYIYDSKAEGRKQLGTVSGVSQGVNVIQSDDNWALVEAYRNEDGAFVRGYMRTNRLRETEPNTTYGLVIDKASQTLIVFRNGERVGSCSVSTGLATPEYLHRETPAGEFITVTRRGTIEYGSTGYCANTVRINGNYHLCEIPTTKKGGSDYSLLADSLGSKATRGNICIAHEASSDGGINAKWIWDMTDSNKRVKVLIFDDKDRSEVPVVE